MYAHQLYCLFFFFNDTATTEIYTLSLHDALPICGEAIEKVGVKDCGGGVMRRPDGSRRRGRPRITSHYRDRKSTRLNSSHSQISYAVFCLKKKKKNK